MRKFYCNVLAAIPVAGALLLAACQKPENETPPREKVTLTAVAEQTRTSLGSDDAVLWSIDDAFLLFGDSGAEEMFTLTEGAGTATASFEGYLPEGESFFAAYPADLYAGIDNGWMVMQLPQEQTYVSGTFAERINPMVASAAGDFTQLNFRNVCGILELRITGEGTLASVALSSSQAMSGQIFVPMWTEGVPEVAVSKQGVKMTGINEPLSAEPLSLYFVVPAGTYESLSVVMTDASGAVVVKTATDLVTIERGAITPVEGLVFEETEAETVEVNMTVDEARSSWQVTYVNYELVGNVAANGIWTCAMPQDKLEENLAAGADLKTVLLTLGSESPVEDPEAPIQLGWLTTPDTQQSFLACASVDGELVGEVARMDYRSKAMTIDPSLGFVPEWTVGDTYVSYTATVTGGATRYYAFLGQGAMWNELSDEEILQQFIYNDAKGTELTGTTLSKQIENLEPDCPYEYFLLLEGPNGYSQLYRYSFTTLSLQPGEDTAEYRRFIGTWTMSYTDLLGVGAEAITVTVMEDVAGRTYRVSGMTGSYAASNGFDDTIEAWFENGRLVFRSSTQTATFGDYFNVVAFYPLGAAVSQIGVGQQYIGTYADDVVTFANSNPEYLNGYTFVGYAMDGGEEVVLYASNAYGDVVWTREPSGSQGSVAVVEQFVRKPAVNPVWK